MAINKDKFKKLVHYICYRAEPSKLGAVKLNKILWYSDVFSYLKTGTPMTGESYVKRQFGPVPATILSSIQELVDGGNLVVRECLHFGHQKREFVYLTEPDMSIFTGPEVDTVNRMIDIICNNHTAKSISELTHDKIYELADIGEEIPFYATLASGSGEINESDVAWGMECLGIAAQMRTIVEEHIVSNNIDQAVGQYPRLEDVYQGIQWYKSVDSIQGRRSPVSLNCDSFNAQQNSARVN